MITSKQNPRIKNLVRLQKASERRKQNRVLLEGDREILRAVKAGLVLRALYCCPEIEEPGVRSEIISKAGNQVLIEEVSLEVFGKIAYREGTGGFIALADSPDLSLSLIELSENPLIVVLESVEKPGNLGAVLRTADAAGADAVIICDPRTDVFNPNTVRASIGCVFSVPIATCTSGEAIKWLQKNRIKTFATSLEASDDYFDQIYDGPTAIVLGTEADGLSKEWTKAADKRIIIQMRGIADSLNVSTAAAIVIFEAIRQRKSAGKE
jgi:TrmH family RNA methyltransferase